MKLVATIGTFDLLHPGHIAFLKAARDKGDTLAVGVISDGLVKRFKGRRPIMMANERLLMLSAVRCVDYAYIIGDDDYAAWVKAIGAAVLVLSKDHRAERFERAAKAIEEMGGEVYYAERSPLCATSELVRRVREIYE